MPYTDSVPVSTTLPLRGVWIHDPLDAPGSISSYPYGASQRDTSIDAMGAGAFFAGREAPVFDYGEHIDEITGCTVDVPHGTTYRADLAKLRAFAKSKRAFWFRDNRGRVVFGTMSNFKETDQDWGSTVSFNMTQAHRDIETVVV